MIISFFPNVQEEYTGIIKNNSSNFCGILSAPVSKKSESDHITATASLVKISENNENVGHQIISALPITNLVTSTILRPYSALANMSYNQLEVLEKNLDLSITNIVITDSNIEENLDLSIDNVTITDSDTEKSFISNFIKSIFNQPFFSSQGGSEPEYTITCYIGGSSNKADSIQVTSTAEIDNQLDLVFNNSTSIPNIWFSIGNTDFQITREAELNDSSNYYRFYSNDKTNKTLYFCTYSIGNDYSAGREYKYQIVYTSCVLVFIFGGFEETFPLQLNNCFSAYILKQEE